MKGFDIAVRAVLQCPPNVHLLVAGMSFEDAIGMKSSSLKEYADKWHDYIKQHDKDGRIHILGKQLNMSACYAACDVVLFPMREPHQARPVFEAGYFSKTVIITDFDCIHGDVQEGGNGYFVPTEDVQAIAEKIKRLYADSDLTMRMGRMNHEHYQNTHSCEICLNMLKDCLEEIGKK